MVVVTTSACAEPEVDRGTESAGSVTADSSAARDTGAAVTPAGTPTGADAWIGERSVGHVRLGMSEAELRAGDGSARDTTWLAEGMEERGVVVPLGRGTATAVLSNGAVSRIIIRDRALATPAGLGVGATLGALRAAYGRECAAVAEDGRAVVWFAGFPGVSFALDQRPGERANEIQRDPSLLPDAATVEALWIHGENVVC